MGNTPSPHSSLLPRLNLIPSFFTSFPSVAQGDTEWVLCSIQHMLSLPLLPPQRKNSSHSFSLVPPMRDIPLWNSPTWVLPRGCSSWETAPESVPNGVTSPDRKSASAMASQRVTASFGHARVSRHFSWTCPRSQGPRHPQTCPRVVKVKASVCLEASSNPCHRQRSFRISPECCSQWWGGCWCIYGFQ